MSRWAEDVDFLGPAQKLNARIGALEEFMALFHGRQEHAAGVDTAFDEKGDLVCVVWGFLEIPP